MFIHSYPVPIMNNFQNYAIISELIEYLFISERIFSALKNVVFFFIFSKESLKCRVTPYLPAFLFLRSRDRHKYAS